ncbi:MAG: protein kinase [bacterium]|nr:protein kinase [bacterium]
MSWFDSLTAMFKDHRVDVAKRFEFSREAIHGTMSKFRQAFDHERKETVGLKILDDEKLGNFEARFKGLKKPTEGEIAVQLHHPHIVKTYEFGETTDRQQYIVMEFVEGQGLNALIQDRTEALNGKRVQLIRQMAEAIDAVHKAGFIHRDICPRNFICDVANANIKLIDFGLTIPDEAP